MSRKEPVRIMKSDKRKNDVMQRACSYHEKLKEEK
ncbi:hypothetical protein JOC86_002140 [Bacillus pakistanensis]|uniref:Ribosomal protein S14 n=1 Tax=Rossellomorea pakistanensis TaxID=992288 RepID=A0ABS2NCM6_9BACI|nr:hypothetical protein [Bacillus pakistanensis]